MTLLAKLERKFDWIAIGRLPIYIVTAQSIVYVWGLLNPGGMNLLILDPYSFYQQKEYWRVLTFLFVTDVQNPLFAFFYLYLLYIYGTALEDAWGSFHFTLFYLVGALGTILASLVFGSISGSFFVNVTIFLAFAVLYPNFILHLFFILPVKVKWLAWATWVMIIFSFFTSPIYVKAAIAVSVANYFLFFSKQHYQNIKAEIERLKHRQRFKNWGSKDE